MNSIYKNKINESEKIKEKTNEFLKNGGKITYLKKGETASEKIDLTEVQKNLKI